jgi:thiol-disulfide isomerase/thioredoxin
VIRVVHFTAPWCAPCKAVTRALGELAPAYPQVEFSEVDVDAEPTSDVLALPTVLVLRDGEVVARLEGARRRRDYERALAEVLPAAE